VSSLAISAATFALLAAGIFATRWPHRAGAPPRDPTFRLGGPDGAADADHGHGWGSRLLATMVGRWCWRLTGDGTTGSATDLKRRARLNPARGGWDGEPVMLQLFSPARGGLVRDRLYGALSQQPIVMIIWGWS